MVESGPSNRRRVLSTLPGQGAFGVDSCGMTAARKRSVPRRGQGPMITDFVTRCLHSRKARRQGFVVCSVPSCETQFLEQRFLSSKPGPAKEQTGFAGSAFGPKCAGTPRRAEGRAALLSHGDFQLNRLSRLRFGGEQASPFGLKRYAAQAKLGSSWDDPYVQSEFVSPEV